MSIGESVKHLRLLKNWSQSTLASNAGVSMNAVKHIESGGGSVKSLICICKVLGKEDWLKGLAPIVSINPLNMVRGKPRQRAVRSKQSIPITILNKMGFVYFIQEHGRGHIKIGYSAKPEFRLKVLQAHNGVKLTMLKTFPGTQKAEKDLHKKFKHFHANGEWYYPARVLLEFIESI